MPLRPLPSATADCRCNEAGDGPPECCRGVQRVWNGNDAPNDCQKPPPSSRSRQVAERINQLGGKPNFNPEGILMRSASQYVEGANLVEMIKENLIAERIACEHYRELIRYFADKDPTTRVMMEAILTNEEEHANDMHDLLVAHEGKPMLQQ